MTEVVSQAAREAAAGWCHAQPFASKQAEAPMILAGDHDHHSLVQAFAKFEQEVLERAARVAESHVDQRKKNLRADLDCVKIATAIRALTPSR